MDAIVMDLRRGLASGTGDTAQAVVGATAAAHGARGRGARIDAWTLLGELAGRAHGSSWVEAERAAWALLALALEVDTSTEQRALVLAMGRGFRNQWFLPFVHARLTDDDPEVVRAAITAAGGLGFSALEEPVAAFLGPGALRADRLAAIAALGRMGSVSTAARLALLVAGDADESAAALTALTEIRSPLAMAEAQAALATQPAFELRVAAMRYLAELGSPAVLPELRRAAREEDPALRTMAGLCARAWKAERARDAGERILVALTEPDRAVRALLARRLRTLPVADVLAQAETLLGDDAPGVIQVVGEVRAPEVTRYLLDLAKRPALPAEVRARAVGAIEANEPWERQALAEIIAQSDEEPLRAAAARALGGFASLAEVLNAVAPLGADPSPVLRGARLWALQLAGRTGRPGGDDRAHLEADLRRSLADADPGVRRRAAYVAGNLHLTGLAADLLTLARQEDDRPDLRVAALTGLAELGAPDAIDGLSALWKREEDPAALAATSRALARTLARHPELRLDAAKVEGKATHLLKAADAVAREAAVRVAGLGHGAITAHAILPLCGDPAPRVRAEALATLGRLAAPEAEATLVEALHEPDPMLSERAASALVGLGTRGATLAVLAYCASEADPATRATLARRLQISPAEARLARPALDAALARLPADDPAAEPLLAHKARLFDERPDAPRDAQALDRAITALFPAWAQLGQVRGFAPLASSLRTAEALATGTGTLDGGDCSPPITLWMKSLEGYLHAFLSPRLAGLQRELGGLCNHVDQLLASWPAWQRVVAEHWKDSVDVGGARVEVSLRSAANALREYETRRPKRLDQPLSVTEWARLLLFLGVDHPSGVRNLLKVRAPSAERQVRLVHRMQVLAAVRNLVTHRGAADATMVQAFRSSYYQTFEDLTHLA